MIYLIIKTQVYKNRIGEDWNGKGTPPKKWELHTNKEYNVAEWTDEEFSDLSEADYNARVREESAKIVKSDAFTREHIISVEYSQTKAGVQSIDKPNVEVLSITKDDVGSLDELVADITEDNKHEEVSVTPVKKKKVAKKKAKRKTKKG